MRTNFNIKHRAQAALQALQQPETVTRSSTIQIARSGIEDIDAPDDITTYYDLYEEIGIIRANLNQFVSDVTRPGGRVIADDDSTEDYFNGADDNPEDWPKGGFLENCYVIDETHQPYQPLLKQSVLNRWVRGTFMSEVLKQDNSDPESIISGYRPIRPETVSARAYDGTNILIDPDPDSELNDDVDLKLTDRDEAAAYVQFDEQSILGRRINGFDENSVFLSQNDVFKLTLDQNIGGPDQEDGIFGVSIIKAIKDDAEEYRDIKRNLTKAIQNKAWGIYDAQFNTQFIEAGEENILIEWDDDEIDDWVDDVDDINPGDILAHDGSVTLQKWEGEVPDLVNTLRHYVDDILAPLPAPKYTVGFETDINQFVTEQQDQRYEQIIQEERKVQEEAWTDAFKEVARRHDDLDPEGLQLQIQPEQDESPVMSLESEVIDRINTFAQAVERLEMSTLVSDEMIRELILQLPAEDEGGLGESLEGHDHLDGEEREVFEQIINNGE